MKTIMIVEDDPITAMNEMAILNDYGYRVIIADTGEKAVDMCREGEVVDLILMDIDLGPGMDGPEAAQKILAERTLPIVFLTSHSEREMVEKVRGITRYGYVIKDSGDFVLTSSIEMAFDLFDAHKKAHAESQRNAAILRGIPDLLFVIDRRGRYQEIYVPDSSVLPFPQDEVIGKTLDDIFGSDEAERLLGVFDRCFQTEQAQSVEYELELAGEKRQYDARITKYDGNSILAISRDITERKRADELLRESETKYRQLFHNAPAGIYEVDFATQRFTKVNSLICEYTGYTEKELLTMNPTDILTEESRKIFLERVENILKGMPVSKETEYCIKEKDGRTRWVELHNEFLSRDGIITGAAVVAHDITARKQAEESINAFIAERELLLREVHHRIKNNLNMVKSLLMLQSRALNSPEASRALKDAAGRMQSMEILYDKLYRTEGFRDLNMKDFLPPLIEEIFDVFPDTIPVTRNIHVEDIVLSSKVLLPIGIIVYELITNSKRYAFRDRDNGIITLSAEKNGNVVTVHYSDNGIGLPATVTVESSTGFGMKLVGMMVKQIRASLLIERSQGTKYTIRLEV
ncbi:MAG TPA: PAS domain S-box protein [Spirochaetota bacterium]|nr:PAS domain S-box protein [Spirochaetota bacterium]